eukprot:TRINITY_DN3598_c0_g1_i1.p3 TRINITY_DN3598_c0_g1~~TRINITY_DN3598_c0_g1_i1.p3  ORF type:complete len:529 (+),score=59.77 TRINITY_DN3598_c0_g1_i1:2779-4365(+)
MNDYAHIPQLFSNALHIHFKHYKTGKMNKSQKLEYQQRLENYMEEHQVYDLLEGLLRSLLKEKPKDPVDFLISRLENPEPKRIFVVGPPGSNKKEIAQALAGEFSFTVVSLSELLDKEISKKTPAGSQIESAKSKSLPVSDEIILELIFDELEDLEKKSKSYIVAGFPQNIVQALALQDKGIVPDRLFVFSSLFDKTLQAIKNEHKELNESDTEALVSRLITEYNMYFFACYDQPDYRNIKDVKKAFNGFYCEVNQDQSQETIIAEMARMLRIRLKSNAPRRPPRVLITGPPGAGKTTVGNLIAKKYGLVFVSAGGLLEHEIESKTSQGQVAAELRKKGEIVPDEIVGKLVEARLNQSDCKVNGWVLEGFPLTESQIRILKGAKQTPSLVIGLQLDDDVVYERNEFKKVDPETGLAYNLKEESMKPSEEVLARLVTRECDKHDVVKSRLKRWKEFTSKLEEAYKEHKITLAADKPVQVIVEAISDAIENPLQSYLQNNVLIWIIELSIYAMSQNYHFLKQVSEFISQY